MVRNAQETTLAWALIDAVKPHLRGRERNYVFVSVGAGDTSVAIHRLLKLITARDIRLPHDLVRQCATWLDSYGLHEDPASLWLRARYVEPHIAIAHRAPNHQSLQPLGGAKPNRPS